MAIEAKSHFERNRGTYQTIDTELDRVRESFESLDGLEQKMMLVDSVNFAVLSVQAPIDQLRQAFRGYVRSESVEDLRNSLQSINYSNNKLRYIKHNIRAVVGADDVIESLENGDTWDAIRQIEDTFLGVSWIKSAFVPAMLGYKDVMCIDTNVAQAVDGSVSAREYSSLASYQGSVGYVMSQFPDLSETLDPFLVQWVVFDANRGDGVALHTEWFEHILPDPAFGGQNKLTDY